MLGLPRLKELWLVGTKVTKEAAEEIDKELPRATVYH